MTVSSTNRRSGPYSGDGVTTEFSYTFRILDGSHVAVIRTSNGSDNIVDPSEYTVTGVGDAPGGSVVFFVPPAIGQVISILRRAPFTQEVDLENQGAFFAEVIEEALDLAAMRDQQLQEQLDRALKISVGSESAELDDLAQSVRAVAEISGDVVSVASISGDVSSLAGISSDVSAVAGVSGDVSVVAANVADVTNFADVYLGPFSSDPATRNDGSALQVGDLYFNTAGRRMQVWQGDRWGAATAPEETTRKVFTYTASAGQTVFSGLDDGGNDLEFEDGNFLNVFLNGIRLQETADYTADDTTNSVTLTVGAALNDVLQIEAFGRLNTKITVSDQPPTGGSAGDLWFQYSN